MKKSLLLWLLAIIITVSIAIYQRLTGPTYPISGAVHIQNEEINYKFHRSHGGPNDHEVKLFINNPEIKGKIYYKRYKTDDEWTTIPMERKDSILTAKLPHQPPAGKLEYFAELNDQNNVIEFPKETVVIRFKGDVPLTILIPHIIAMFMSMLLSNRTGLEFFNKGKNIRKLTYWTIGTLIIGGFILGPLTQKYAFGELWTGFPFGYDLTDNKTLLALIGWLFSLYMYGKSKSPKLWALFGSAVLLIVYLIPHSVMGSELDYNKLDKQNEKTEYRLLE